MADDILFFKLSSRGKIIEKFCCRIEWDEAHVECVQIGRFISLWVTFQACVNNYFGPIAHILGKF